jgi:general secretion pathway protein A
MSYYLSLGLAQEPFSTSPDPDFFYETESYSRILINLMIEVRLRRGLSLVLGDVGTGKTTLSRKLFQMLASRRDIVVHMVLDPSFDSSQMFFESLARAFGIGIKGPEVSLLDVKAAIKDYLFKTAVRQGKTIVLIVDEAQKLSKESLEDLRLLLNYETNEYKMLQLILLGQLELNNQLEMMRNFTDRVSLRCQLGPFDLANTIAMIEYRLGRAGYNNQNALFSQQAYEKIYQQSNGYPRRIGMLCHGLIKELLIKNKTFVDDELVEEYVQGQKRLACCTV